MADRPPDKSSQRQRLLAQRQALAPDCRGRWDAAIVERLTALLAPRAAATIGVYYPIRGEPDVRAAYAQWAARGIQLALPIVIDKKAPLKFVAWAPNAPLVRDALGVPVPADRGQAVQPDVLLVPCVGFNASGVRLGYGGGYYDRTLAHSPRPLAIGVAYACSFADFGSERHDIGLDVIVTEQSSAWFKPPQ